MDQINAQRRQNTTTITSNEVLSREFETIT